jgi:hypothetical protein
MSGLWRNHNVSLPSEVQKLTTQTDWLLSMLREKRAANLPLELSTIASAGIMQYSARLNELRRRGHIIHNERKRSPDGRVFSCYWFAYDVAIDGPQIPLFFGPWPETARHRDDG